MKASVPKNIQMKELPLFSCSVENNARIVLVFSNLNIGLAIPHSKVTEGITAQRLHGYSTTGKQSRRK